MSSRNQLPAYRIAMGNEKIEQSKDGHKENLAPVEDESKNVDNTSKKVGIVQEEKGENKLQHTGTNVISEMLPSYNIDKESSDHQGSGDSQFLKEIDLEASSSGEMYKSEESTTESLSKETENTTEK